MLSHHYHQYMMMIVGGIGRYLFLPEEEENLETEKKILFKIDFFRALKNTSLPS